MINTNLYRDHLAVLDRHLTYSLERAAAAGLKLDGVLFHSGRLEYFHADDQMVPFRPTPHFLRWVPENGPESMVLARPGRKPLVVRVRPKDYWYDMSAPELSFWEAAVDLKEAVSFEDGLKAIGDLTNIAWIGGCKAASEAAGVPVDLYEPDRLMAPMDWHRGYKSEYEIQQIRQAAVLSAAGHEAARATFLAGGSEREIHWAYLEGADHLEFQVPYETIVALNPKGAILHYQHKRGNEAAPGKALLIDAGAASDGYAADITRTWCAPDADPVFVEMVRQVDAIERKLVDMVTTGRPYGEIHAASHRFIAEILADAGIVKGSADEALEKGITRAFYPHGVGHHLGLQVHDVGGHQEGPDGGKVAPPEEHPALRTTRPLDNGHVVTIEPGIYFIDMLLEPVRNGADAALVDWAEVDRLSDHGGIRIEDNIVCTPDGPRDLTRDLIEGP